MAMLHGFEILDMRSFNGREGVGTQGTVWLDGEELGFWSNDGDGGMDRFEFPTAKLDELVAEQCDDIAWTSYDGTRYPADLSLLLANLADLEDLEQQWRQADAEGEALVVVSDTQMGGSVAYPIRKADEDTMSEMVGETAGEYAYQAGFEDYDVAIYTAQYQFEQGARLVGKEEALADIREHQERLAKYRR